MSENNNIVLVMGRPNTGKTTSLMNMPNQEQYVYLNADLKDLPFPGNFAANVKISDPMDIGGFIDEIEANDAIAGAVIDTLTFLMSMFERQYVNTATNTQKAWGDYANFYKDLIHKIKSGTKHYAILAHADIRINEQTADQEEYVPIKGSVGRTGIEADFTTVLASRQVDIKQLEGFENDLLHITEDEEEDEVKYCFETRVTKHTRGAKMRSAIGLWDRKERFIDNDLSKVFARLDDYYGKSRSAA